MMGRRRLKACWIRRQSPSSAAIPAGGRSAAAAPAETTRSSQSVFSAATVAAPIGRTCRKKSRRARISPPQPQDGARGFQPSVTLAQKLALLRSRAIIPRMSVTRRDFLKSAGVTSLASAVTTIAPPDADAQTAPRIVGPGDVPVTLMVNGKRLDLKIEPRVTLLDAIRNRADLTGNKRVCDRGTCGACTMIVDGRTVSACSTLAIEAQGKQIRTVDGLAAANSTLHPVQQAFCDTDGLMCGFCTPGFVVATAAVLRPYPNATRAQISKGLDGNICRCGTFVRIMEAALKAKGMGVARG